jgi:hypothetical protein
MTKMFIAIVIIITMKLLASTCGTIGLVSLAIPLFIMLVLTIKSNKAIPIAVKVSNFLCP